MRGVDIGIAEVDLGQSYRSQGLSYGGCGFLFLGNRVVAVLFAQGFVLYQRQHPRQLLLGLQMLRLRGRQVGLGFRKLRLKRSGIDLIQPITFLDVLPFREIPLPERTLDLRPYFHLPVGLDPADPLACKWD